VDLLPGRLISLESPAVVTDWLDNVQEIELPNVTLSAQCALSVFEALRDTNLTLELSQDRRSRWQLVVQGLEYGLSYLLLLVKLSRTASSIESHVRSAGNVIRPPTLRGHVIDRNSRERKPPVRGRVSGSPYQGSVV